MFRGNEIIRFDWAMKRLLRQKANFVVLESFLSELLGDKIKIHRILESEGNKENADDKFNRVDILAENMKGELIIIEVQNTRELYYFQRMLYGTAKAVTEYMHEGSRYSEVKKVYSVNIVYFDLGQGEDYIYHGKSVFTGMHTGDILKLSRKQQEVFVQENAGDIFPEYYVLRVNEFNRHATTPLDEWIDFLKSGRIDKDTQVEGLKAAHECLRVSMLSDTERVAYDHYLDNMRVQWDVLTTARIEGKDEGFAEGKAEGFAEGRVEGRAEGERQKQLEIARGMKGKGLPTDLIAELTKLPKEEILEL